MGMGQMQPVDRAKPVSYYVRRRQIAGRLAIGAAALAGSLVIALPAAQAATTIYVATNGVDKGGPLDPSNTTTTTTTASTVASSAPESSTASTASTTPPSTVAPVTPCGTSSAPCKTIAWALSLAASGDTISVASGTYATPAPIVVGKGVTIRGAGIGATILNGGKPTPFSSSAPPACAAPDQLGAITIRSSNVSIANLSIRNFGSHGISIDNAESTPRSDILIDNVEASNNGIETCAHGIYVGVADASANADTTRVNIVNSTLKGNRIAGIGFEDGKNVELLIKNNKISDNGDAGITVNGGAGTIERNTLKNNGRFGIELRNPSGSLSVKTNTVVASNNDRSTTPTRFPILEDDKLRDYAGISVVRRTPNTTTGQADPMSGTTIKDNVVSGYLRSGASNSVGDGFGIVVEGSNHNVNGNTLYRNDVGVQFQSGASLDITGEKSYDRGDSTTSVSSGFSGNAICGNKLSGARLVGSSALTPMTGSGNWWGTRYGPTTNGGTRGSTWSASGTIGPDDVDGDISVRPPLSAKVGSIPSDLICKYRGKLTVNVTGLSTAGVTKATLRCSGIGAISLSMSVNAAAKVIEDLRPGTTCTIAATAPNGYKTLATKSLTISSSSTTSATFALVKKTSTGSTLPPTGGGSQTPSQIGIGIAVLLLGLGALLVARRQTAGARRSR